MTPVAFIYDPLFLKHDTGSYHPENAQRLRVILEDIEAFRDELLWLKPFTASIAQIEMVHPHTHIEKIKEASVHATALDPDTQTSHDSYQAALMAVGAGIKAVDAIAKEEISYAFCAVRPPGHHATATQAMGFCLFNNIAVTARYAQSLGYQKVMIVDFDVHHGNGTQSIFYDDPTVLYFSTHQYPAYPGSGAEEERGSGAGEGYTCNHPLEMFSGDKEILPLYEQTLYQEAARFQPDIVLVSAGYDLHEDDPLAQLQVTTEGIGKIVDAIMQSYDAPKIFLLEGGYNLDALAKSVALTLKVMQRYT